MKNLTCFLAGIIFAVGLAISGMTDPQRIIGFLDFFGRWDPTLLLVMTGAIGVYAPAYWMSRRALGKPVFGEVFSSPASTRIDARLVGGSLLFGIGWGLAGYCPGPALVSVGSGSAHAIIFSITMLGASWVTRAIESRRDGVAAAAAAMRP